MDTLPRVTVSWAEPAAISAPDVWAQYNVYRQMAGDTVATRIAVITAHATVSYIDYTCPAGAVATYTVTQSSYVAGLLVESVPATATCTLAFHSAFIHDVASVANYGELLVTASSLSPKGDVIYKQVAGQLSPVAFIGESQQLFYQITDRPHSWADMSYWTALLNLQTRQRANGAIFCLRVGSSGAKLFCAINGDGVTRSDEAVNYTPSLAVTQVAFSEAL